MQKCWGQEMRKPIIGLAMLAHTRGALAKAVEQRLTILPMHGHKSFALGTMSSKLGHYSSIPERMEKFET